MNDDFNTAKTIASLFNLTKQINKFNLGQQITGEVNSKTFERLITEFNGFIFDVLGLKEENYSDFNSLLAIVLDEYKSSKENKNYDKVDEIRASLKQQGIVIKDMKDKIDWAWDE